MYIFIEYFLSLSLSRSVLIFSLSLLSFSIVDLIWGSFHKTPMYYKSLSAKEIHICRSLSAKDLSYRSLAP